MNEVMTAKLETFLHEQIPLAKALGVSVVEANDLRAEVRCPLAPNINHLGTAFGGSLSAMLILAGYTWLYQAMESRGFKCHVILRRSEVDYREPVDHDFAAIARGPSEEDLEKFLQTYKKKGRARIALETEIFTEKNGAKVVACHLQGEFVAQAADHSRLS